MKVSIVIPTYLRPDKLKLCLESVTKYTDLSDTEIIVVANGAPEETRILCADYPVKLLWYDEPLGFPKACNIGLRATNSEFAVLLNDDCVLLDQPKNRWIEMLLEPFSDPCMGITGAQRELDRHSQRLFLIFFCVMLRRTMLEELGYLDESTKEGYGEDSIMCIEAERLGWNWRQVPDELSEPGMIDGQRIWVNHFPLYHAAEATFHQIPEHVEIVARNSEMLREKYLVDISRAQQINGWMSDSELQFLALEAKYSKVVIECGSWMGRSSRAIADNLPDDGVLYCVDAWRGSVGEEHPETEMNEGDYVYMKFCEHLADHIQTGKVRPIRMESKNAASVLRDMGVKADLLFLDGSHDYESVKQDIAHWRSMLSEDGVFCGHDYLTWESVTRAVNDTLKVVCIPNTSIWRAKMHWQALTFMERVRGDHLDFFSGKKVLEVGSLDINGSVRYMFTDCDYTGIDIGAGPGVDKVVPVHELIEPEMYDVVISSEMLEHDQHWEKSLVQMYANLKPGGLFVLTCAGPLRAEHGTSRVDPLLSPFTNDHYRNISIQDFQTILPCSKWADAEWGYRDGGEDLYFFGIKPGQSNLTVTVEISTLNRYFTTLPMAISSVIAQTRKPDKLVIYDDGEQNELRDIEPYRELFRLLETIGIPFETFKTPRKGLAANHQHALENATTDLLLRLDDDIILQPNTLETLLEVMKDESVGAVAPLIHQPEGAAPLPMGIEGKLDDVFRGVNLQWFSFNSGQREVEHLYSAYLYRVEAGRKAGGYPELSPVSFREDTWFSMKIRQAGYKLIVTPYTKAWHLQQRTGGIRSFSDGSLWAEDDKKFSDYLTTIGQVKSETKLIVADMGLGDTLLLKGIWPEIRRKNPDKKFTLALCYPEAFSDVDDVTIISIAQAKMMVGNQYDDFSVYAYAWKHGKHDQPLVETMQEFWG